MTTVRDALNELKWRQNALDDHVHVTYVHRGAPGDVRTVKGDAIRGLGPSFMELEGRGDGTFIPYHRILLVERDGDAVWQRHASGRADGT